MSGKALDAVFEDLKIPQKPTKVKPGVGPNAIRAERSEQETDSVAFKQETVSLLSKPF